MEKLNLNGSQQSTAKITNGQLCSNDRYSIKSDKNKSLTRKTKYERRQQTVNHSNVNASGNVNSISTTKRNYLYEWRPRHRGSSGEAQPSSSAQSNWHYKVNSDEMYDDWNQLSDDRNYSKKRNVNHLLNFSFTPRDKPGNAYNEIKSIGKNAFKQKQVYPKFSKEQFLQANCQFIVKAGNDYSLHSADPDLPVNWDFIEEIRCQHFKTQTTVCPICLHTPIAAKITKCGHIYCWSCILHYFALSDSPFRKCPICYHSITRNDLRSVSFIERSDFNIGEEIELRLLKRKRGSTLTYPVHSSETVLEDGNKKLLVMDSKNVINEIVSREFNQLCFQLSNERNTPEACFIENAMQSLNERKATVEAALIAAESDEKSLKDVASACSIPSSSLNNLKQNLEIDDTENYYFYQSTDGQHIYLHSLNVRMLCNEFGSLDKCPAKINGKIVSMDWSSMTEEKRKRYRYIQHLPLTCEYRTVELDLSSPILSKKTFDTFKADVERRKNERSRKEKEERKREKRLRNEGQRIGDSIGKNRSLSSECDQIYVPVRNVSESESSSIGDANGNDEIQPGSSADNKKSVSFASMLKTESVKNQEKKIVSEQKKVEKMVYTAGESDDELVAKPLRQYSLSDAFEAALNLKSNPKGKRKNKKKN